MRYLVILLTLLVSFIAEAKNVKPVHLTVENKEQPIGIEAVQPHFGWNLYSDNRGIRQVAWQIQVASSRQKLENGEADLWDSGKQQGSQQQFIAYAGKPLQSASRYFWRVKAWMEGGEASEWSTGASFVTAILHAKEWNNSQWIAFEQLPDNLKVVPGVHGGGDNLGAKAVKRAVIPLFRHKFSLDKKVKEAFLFVSGLGQYEARLNGQKIGNDFLAPGWTNYQERCLYNSYEVTDFLAQGENVLGAIVGTGFRYINRERYRKMVRAEGYPMLRLKLIVRYTDGSQEEMTTDETWRTAPSPITYSSIYGGEDYDANLEQDGWDQKGFDDGGWEVVRLVDGPQGRMHAQTDYPLKVMQTFDVKEKRQIAPGQYVYDFGQNASGIVQLAVRGKKGTHVRITPAEILDDKGLPSQKASGAPYYFEYVLKGEGKEVWEPRFTYYGFRYALVTLDSAAAPDALSDMELKFLHTRNSSPTVGSFACSNPLFNQIDELIKWGIKSNLASVATDCPHREKLGWLEQTHLIGSSIKYNFDIYQLYNKVVDDMIEGQLPNGLVPDIVPEYVPFEGGFRDSPEWGSASIIIPWYHYQWYGDQRVLQKAYPMMKRYLAYLGTKADGHILSHGLGDWFDLGPKGPGVSQLTPIALTATATYFYDAKLLAEIAQKLGNETDARTYRQLAAAIKKAFNEKFYDPAKAVYATGSQTAFAMPLYMGLVDDENKAKVEHNLMDSIRAGNKALTAGDVGYRYLLRALEEAGASQLIYEMNNRDDVPGYGYQIKHGATALTESWPALKYVSNNHMMLGHLMEWLYSGLAGIKQQDGDFGFHKILIAPEMVDGLDWVKTSYQAMSGEIKVHWMKKGEKATLNVTVPANAEAKILLPTDKPEEIKEGGKPLESSPYLHYLGQEGEKAVVQAPSGTYQFVFTNP